MIERFRQRIHYNYINPVDRQRAYGLTIMNATIAVGWVVGMLALVIPSFFTQTELPSDFLISFVAAPIVIFVLQRFILNSALRAASWLFVAFLFIFTFLPNSSSLITPTIVALALPVVAAGVLLKRNEFFLMLAVVSISVFISGYYQSQIKQPLTVVPADLVVYSVFNVVLVLVITGIFLYVFSGNAEQLAEESLINRARLEALSDFDQQLAVAQDENTVMLRVAELVTDRLVYTACYVYLFDNRGELNRYVRTGMGTRHAVTRSNLNQENAVQQAIDQRQTVLISLEDDPARRNHLLPSARFAIAIPLIHDQRVIGALDIQSNRPVQPFTPDEQTVLKLVASEFTSALVRVRENMTMQMAMQEREIINNRLQNQIADLKRSQEQSVGTDWQSYIQGRGKVAFGFDLQRDDMALVPAADLPPELRPALESGEMVVQNTPSGQIVNVPIMFRGEILGAMAFTLPPGRSVSERQLEMAQIVSQRLALALENARLVEQSQAQAARERKAGEIASLLIGQQEVSALINVAAQNFNEALGAIYTRIYLEPEALAAQVGE